MVIRQLLAGFCLASAVSAQDSPDGAPGQPLQTMSIQAPTMSEEDQYGLNMPSQYKCEGCRAIVYHMNSTFEATYPEGKAKPKEWQVMDTLEAVCKTKFEGYGLSMIGGQNRLKGPGLAYLDEEIGPGGASMMMSSENWKKRLAEECRKLIEEIGGEVETYDLWKSGGMKSWDPICNGVSQEQVFCKGDKEAEKERKAKAKKDKKEKEKKEKEEKEKKRKEKLDAVAFFEHVAAKFGSDAKKLKKKKTAAQWEEQILDMAEMIKVKPTLPKKDEL